MSPWQNVTLKLFTMDVTLLHNVRVYVVLINGSWRFQLNGLKAINCRDASQISLPIASRWN